MTLPNYWKTNAQINSGEVPMPYLTSIPNTLTRGGDPREIAEKRLRYIACISIYEKPHKVDPVILARAAVRRREKVRKLLV